MTYRKVRDGQNAHGSCSSRHAIVKYSSLGRYGMQIEHRWEMRRRETFPTRVHPTGCIISRPTRLPCLNAARHRIHSAVHASIRAVIHICTSLACWHMHTFGHLGSDAQLGHVGHVLRLGDQLGDFADCDRLALVSEREPAKHCWSAVATRIHRHDSLL